MAGEEGSKNNDQINPNSPFYLHPSDYPRQMQVNYGSTDNNFNDWVQEMTNFLFAKNKIGFDDGSIEKTECISKDYMAWMRCDAMVKGWLTIAMEKEIRASVKYANTAAEIWKDLNERFGKESAPRAYELKQILNVTRQDGVMVLAYFTKLRRIWDGINTALPTPRCTCDGCKCEVGKKLVELREKERLYEFLLGLDNDFTVIRTQILAMKPTPSLSNLYHMVAEDEHQKTSQSGRKQPQKWLPYKSIERIIGHRRNRGRKMKRGLSKQNRKLYALWKRWALLLQWDLGSLGNLCDEATTTSFSSYTFGLPLFRRLIDLLRITKVSLATSRY